MSGLTRTNDFGQRIALAHTNARIARILGAVERDAIVRTARTQGEELVQGEKLKAIDHLAREAMTGQAMLSRFKDVLAAGDPFLTDELRFFTEMAKIGKGEVIADTVDTFC